MLAMQYAFAFADDFDMRQIRQRVAEKGPLFDDYPGLVQKAFLVNDVKIRILGDEIGNSYAAFYLWESDAAARDFLLGDAFQAVAGAFGRPRVRLWQVLAFEGQGSIAPHFAVQASEGLADSADVGLVAARERRLLAAGAERPGLQSAVVALDPYRWELLRFSLWRDAADAEDARNGNSRGCEVLHLSAPGAVVAPSIETPIAELAQLRSAYQ
jgi:hypothetical protein